MTDEQRRALAASFGLNPDEASEADVMAAASAAAEARAAGDSSGSDADDTDTADAETEDDRQPIAARSLPPGAVVIDAQELERLRAGTATAETLARQQAESDRDTVLAAALREGRFAPSRREHWLRAWQADPEGTRHLLTAGEEEGGLAPNSIPIAARGAAPADDTTNASADAQHDAFMARHFPQARRRERQEA